ncbi:protein xmas-2 [Scaptodrosophila lebanonensis]|uniref:Protein xmas-2 n=1 Tax=Drosophila lebanonensis TaxID=7225 RepID=A0A6J2UEH2_DROLE|nr:protein xmas-2 [Scaptodrosophila lebanonensis]
MADSRPGDDYNYKTLLCTNIPELFLDKYVARSHFGRFGTLVNFVLRPRRMTCTVSYANESEAALALREGNYYNGQKFEMSYAENETTPAQKTEEWVDSEVQAELSALSAGWRSEYGSGKSMWGSTAASTPAGGSGLSSTKAMTTKSTATASSASERQRSTAQYNSAKNDLETIMRKPAFSSEEKYRVLDARDKLLRQQMRRTTDIASAGSTYGHCPDMCPEKERVLREFQRQVAVYELKSHSDELIDHRLAVKEYSRSSADQETPLLHELRPEPVLHMTMAYLMHEIMDRSESRETNMGDWFHFLWDRTRSIRKEITQQELCSLDAVKLVEQCARFHIHCAARLVAEDPSVFDSKINAENLTKCLQTLKYMYHDLRLKGVQCPREAEFRSYIVLLNLADANFLWDIAQLPIELQGCAQIKHAIKFYLALQDTNFVRFFELVRDPETTYLSACILLTYFTRLRVLALRRLVQSYRAPRLQDSSLPVRFVTKMLGFVSEEEAIDFLEYYKLKVWDARVVLVWSAEPPDVEYKLQRQLELVESKRSQSVGECICGEPLPPKSLYRNHRPHNSFNEQGYLKSSAWTAKDQIQNGVVEPDEEQYQQQEEELEDEVHQQQQPEKLLRKSPTDNLFKVPKVSVVMPQKSKAFGNPLMEQKVATSANPTSIFDGLRAQAPAETTSKCTFNGNIFGMNPRPTTPNMAPSIFSAVKQSEDHLLTAEMMRRREEEAAKLEKLHQEIARAKQREAELLAAKDERQKKQRQQEEQRQRQLEEQRQRQQEEQRQRLQEKQHRQKLLEQQQQLEELQRQKLLEEQQQQEAAAREQRAALQREVEHRRARQSDQLFNQLLLENLQDICGEEVRLHCSATAEYTKLLDSITAQLVAQELHRAHYELGLMQRFWNKWRSYRRAHQHKDELFARLPLNFNGESSSELVGKEQVPLHMIRRYRQGEPCNYRTLLEGMEYDHCLKLDLWQLLSKSLPIAPGERKYFKLLLSLPSGVQGLPFEHALDRGLLRHPLEGPSDANDGTFYIRGLAHNVALCVHKIQGLDMSASQLLHADGAVFFARNNPAQLEALRLRVQQLCQQSGISYLALIFQDADQLDEIALGRTLQLQSLNLHAYRIYGHRSSARKGSYQRIVMLLHRAVKFLASQSQHSRNILQQVELREWLVGSLGNELFSRLQHALEQDVALARHCRADPQLPVALYNEAVRRLQLVAGEDLHTLRQFPEELRPFVEPLPPQAPLPNRLEYFVADWQTAAYRTRIVQILELAKLPEIPPKPKTSDLGEHDICEWLLAYAQASQDEALVETVALNAIQRLANEREMNYLAMVGVFAKERLQFVLRGARSLPPACVFRRRTMQAYFESQWYYDWHRSLDNNIDGSCHEMEEEVKEEEEQELSLSIAAATDGADEDLELDYEQIIAHAKSVLRKCEKRRERKTLQDLNDTTPTSPLEANEETTLNYFLGSIDEPENHYVVGGNTSTHPHATTKRRLSSPTQNACRIGPNGYDNHDLSRNNRSPKMRKSRNESANSFKI